MTREDSIHYAYDHGIPIQATKEKVYSIDDNLWGRAIECGEMEDPWAVPPKGVWLLTEQTETEPRDIVIGFEQGMPVSVDGETLGMLEIIEKLNTIVGSYGWGRIDMVENRRVGIKSRETYECPAALALILAHKDLESICLERDLDREKARIEPRYAELIYDGLWFSPLKESFDAFVDKSQEFVTGEVRLRLSPDSCTVTGRRSRALALRLRAGHLRRRRHVPPRGLGRLRPAVGPRHRDLVGPAGLQAPVELMTDLTEGDGKTLWHGRFADGPAEQLLAYTVSLPVRPAPRARRHRRVARPRARPGAGRSARR